MPDPRSGVKAAGQQFNVGRESGLCSSAAAPVGQQPVAPGRCRWGLGQRIGLCCGANLTECFFHLGAQRLRFKNAGAKIGRDAELCGCRAFVELNLFGFREANGDAGGFALFSFGNEGRLLSRAWRKGLGFVCSGRWHAAVRAESLLVADGGNVVEEGRVIPRLLCIFRRAGEGLEEAGEAACALGRRIGYGFRHLLQA